MPFQLKIFITKELIDQCKDCGSKNEGYDIGRNCAVAFALRDIFPDAYITNYYIYPFGTEYEKEETLKIPLPIIAQQFIKLFDSLIAVPKLRLLLPEFEFNVDVHDEVIEQININEVKELIAEDKNKYSFA